MIAEAWWFVLSPVAIAFAGGVTALILDGWERRVAAIAVTFVGSLAAAGSSVWLCSESASFVLADVMLIDSTIYAVWTLIFGLCALGTFGGAVRLSGLPAGGGVSALFAFLSVGSAIIAASLDLLMIVILIEVLAVIGYGLTASIRTTGAKEAALKYFIQGSAATGLFVLGLALAFGLLGGSTRMAVLGEGAVQAPLVALTVSLLIVAGFALKLGAFPFHSWAPDVFQSASSSSAAILASIPKIGVLSALLLSSQLLMRPVADVEFSLLDPTLIFSIMAIASIVFGNLGALRQSDFGRMLGYSGIAHAGYLLVAVAIDLTAYAYAMVLVAGYAIAACTAFIVVEAYRGVSPGWDGSVVGMRGLASRSPLLAAVLAVALLSMTGIPLFAGFWGKLLVFGAAIDSDLLYLAIIGFLGSVVSFGYYGRVLRSVYFEGDDSDSPREGSDMNDPNRPAIAGALIGAVLLVALGVAPLLVGLQPFIAIFNLLG